MSLATAHETAEPLLLDEDFFATMKAHFNQLATNQTSQLQAKLNSNLPSLMHQFGVKHIAGNMQAFRSGPR